MLVWLGYINIGLGVFNMVPAYPLDGGRVLHAILWWRSGNAGQSARIAARIGEGLGLVFVALGAVQVFHGAVLDGIWIAFIGWFLTQAAAQSYRESGAVPYLTRLRVACRGATPGTGKGYSIAVRR
jgi:Zn-dependent protease